jgi:PKD repeat protein
MVMVTVTKQNYYRYTDYVPVTTENIAADFSSNVTDICAGGSISFTDQSLGDPEAWQWTFIGGMPSTSDQQNPSDIVYSEPGIYDVTLTVTKTGQEPSTLTKTSYIHVSAYPVAAFESAGDCAGSETTFTDMTNPGTGNISSWEWNFGDPASSSNTSSDQNPTHVFAAAGTYDVTLITINQGNCSDTTLQTVTIISNPGIASTPTGTSDLCQKATGLVYTTEGATDATSYVWEVSPADAGTITGTELTATFDLASEFTGTAAVKVKGINNCGEGEFSAELPLTVKPLALAPEKPAGTDSVNTNKIASSEFTTAGGANAESYEWVISPSAAGTISGTGTSGTVAWTQDYKGNASISVKSVNTCGASEESEIMTVLLYSTLGIGSKGEEIGITLYPNPNDGKFTLTLNAKGNHEVNIEIFNSAGIEIYTENGVTVSGKITRNIDLPNLSKGIYHLKVTGENGSVVKKFVIQK